MLGAAWGLRLAALNLAVALIISTVTDLRSRRIRDAVTLPALLIQLALSLACGGGAGLVQSLLGALACATPFLLGWGLGAMGMGDVKLMAVVGAAVGLADSIPLLLCVMLMGGLQAAVALAAAAARGRPRPRRLPYAVAIASGTGLAYLWGAAWFHAQLSGGSPM